MHQEEIKFIELIQNIKNCFEEDNSFLKSNNLGHISKNFDKKNALLKEFLFFDVSKYKNKVFIKEKLEEIEKIILDNQIFFDKYIQNKDFVLQILKENSQKISKSTYNNLSKTKSVNFLKKIGA